MSATLFGYAKLAKQGLKAALIPVEALDREARRVGPEFTDQGVANVFCGVVWFPGARRAPPPGPERAPQAAWAFATLNAPPSPPARDALEAACVRLEPQLEPQNVANIWWSFAKLDLRPRPACEAALDAAAARAAASGSGCLCSKLRRGPSSETGRPFEKARTFPGNDGPLLLRIASGSVF